MLSLITASQKENARNETVVWLSILMTALAVALFLEWNTDDAEAGLAFSWVNFSTYRSAAGGICF